MAIVSKLFAPMRRLWNSNATGNHRSNENIFHQFPYCDVNIRAKLMLTVSIPDPQETLQFLLTAFLVRQKRKQRVTLTVGRDNLRLATEDSSEVNQTELFNLTYDNVVLVEAVNTNKSAFAITYKTPTGFNCVCLKLMCNEKKKRFSRMKKFTAVEVQDFIVKWQRSLEDGTWLEEYFPYITRSKPVGFRESLTKLSIHLYSGRSTPGAKLPHSDSGSLGTCSSARIEHNMKQTNDDGGDSSGSSEKYFNVYRTYSVNQNCVQSISDDGGLEEYSSEVSFNGAIACHPYDCNCGECFDEEFCNNGSANVYHPADCECGECSLTVYHPVDCECGECSSTVYHPTDCECGECRDNGSDTMCHPTDFEYERQCCDEECFIEAQYKNEIECFVDHVSSASICYSDEEIPQESSRIEASITDLSENEVILNEESDLGGPCLMAESTAFQAYDMWNGQILFIDDARLNVFSSLHKCESLPNL